MSSPDLSRLSHPDAEISGSPRGAAEAAVSKCAPCSGSRALAAIATCCSRPCRAGRRCSARRPLSGGTQRLVRQVLGRSVRRWPACRRGWSETRFTAPQRCSPNWLSSRRDAGRSDAAHGRHPHAMEFRVAPGEAAGRGRQHLSGRRSSVQASIRRGSRRLLGDQFLGGQSSQVLGQLASSLARRRRPGGEVRGLRALFAAEHPPAGRRPGVLIRVSRPSRSRWIAGQKCAADRRAVRQGRRHSRAYRNSLFAERNGGGPRRAVRLPGSDLSIIVKDGERSGGESCGA